MDRLAIEADPGTVAANPEATVRAVLAVAVADGADPDEWMAKALHSLGGKSSIQVRGDPRYAVIAQATLDAGAVFETAMGHALDELEELLRASEPTG